MNKDLIFPKDKKMQKFYELVIASSPLEEIKKRPKKYYFNDLAESIIGQQLSNKVADVIISRVRELAKEKFGVSGKLVFQPEHFQELTVEDLRSKGLSASKVSYLKNLTTHWMDGSIKYQDFEILDDEEIIRELVQVKGIGRWTAEMFLIFTLGRKDVYSSGDLVLRNMLISLYNLRRKDHQHLQNFSKRWSPNRTLASRILWKLKDFNLAI